MTKIKTIPRTVTALSVLFWGLCCLPLAAEPTTGGSEAAVAGRVFDQSQPLAAVTVYAYDVASYALKKELSDRQGRFLFGALPAGLYKIVAYKEGFLPAVELLMRHNREDRQFVELRLLERGESDVRDAQQYWDARQRIPVDVLREILTLEAAGPGAGLEIRDAALFEAKMAAQGGIENLGSLGQAQLTTAEVGIKGALGQMKVGVDGHYQQLVPLRGGGTIADGEVRTMALHLASPDQSKLTLTTTMSELGGSAADGPGPVDLERYQVRYSGGTKRGQAAISAQYMEENRFYQSGAVDLAEVPEASQSWNIEGSYSRGLSDRTSLRTGLSYRQRLSDLELAGGGELAGSALDNSLRNETVDLYTVADSRIEPRVVVEYGLYSSLRDGQLSLMPHGGLVVELGSDWQARTSMSRRVDAEPESELYPRFTSASYADAGSCRQVGEACYEVVFAHSENNMETFSVGAIHREYAETLRLYFSDDFFDRLESLFLVRGDEVPELQFKMVRKISPRILAKLESNFASGGGGIFYATDQQPYENQVRYLVTSLDTRFQRTSTGIFVAFHHLEQDLNPIEPATGPDGVVRTATGIQVERLQVMLTQDLNALVDMAAKLAIRLNMELSRGATPFALTSTDDTYKKLTGGISVSF